MLGNASRSQQRSLETRVNNYILLHLILLHRGRLSFASSHFATDDPKKYGTAVVKVINKLMRSVNDAIYSRPTVIHCSELCLNVYKDRFFFKFCM